MTSAELRTIRRAAGLTQEALAARLGVATRTLRHWEAGERAIPRAKSSRFRAWMRL